MTHPLLDAIASIDESLTSVADVNAVFMTTEEKATALRSLTQLGARLDAVRLGVLADAADVADEAAARDAAAWLAAQTRVRHSDARADLALAVALDRRWTTLARALRDGHVTKAQAQVIAHCLDQLPDEIGADVLSRAEETLVGHAGEFGPRKLARLGRHIVEVVAPEIADAVEARRLADLERCADRTTRLSLRRRGDGMTRISGLVPDATGTRLATYLEAFTNPRKEGREDAGGTTDIVARLGAHSRRLGRAFCQFLESLDPTSLPVHGGDATTVIVSIDLDKLRSDLATADLLGASHLPGDDDEIRITAVEARRLACNAKIIPAVLGGKSEPLDLGRARRLFSPAQRKALLLRDRHCRAEGCEIPGIWSEAHHWDPWALGGSTDLADGVLLCNHHHHRAHDTAHRAERLPNGDVRFHRRT